VKGLLAFALSALAAAPVGPTVEQMRYAMGTLWTVEAEGPEPEPAVAAAFATVRRLDASLSTYKADSELSRINRDGARTWVTVSPETTALVARALALAGETAGAFDPTVGPLVQLWGFKHLDFRVPDASAIARVSRLVDYHGVSVDVARSAVRFDRSGMALDLGATAKGYAVDRALADLRAAGMTAGRVDGGGNQAVFGPPGRTWRFGVKHPRREGAVLGTIGLTGGGVATAGDAERGFWVNGVRHGHILNPRTGRPATGMLSVTVVARTAEEADALDTPLYVLGVARGLKLLARHPGAEALFVEAGEGPGQFRLTATPGLDWRPEAP
jgi:thiamine biosynthesis lipoprotein